MMKVCKIRIYPNKTQLKLINNTLGCCRYIYNLYLGYNIDNYKNGGKFISGYDFSKIVNKLKKGDSDYLWISNYSSKAVKDTIMRAESAFKKFFKNKGSFPRFKSRKRTNKESFFIVKDSIHYTNNKNIIKLPILGKTRITDYKSLPKESSITGGRIIREYDKYYVMLNYTYNGHHIDGNDECDIGIDLGLKHYATIASENRTIRILHFKNNKKYKKLNDRITKLQQIISKKAEVNYGKLYNEYMTKHHCETPNEKTKNIMKGESYNSSHIRSLKKKIRVLHAKKANLRQDCIYKLVDLITAKAKPSTITIENLDISEMIKHTHECEKSLHKYIGESGFYAFRIHLIAKCNEYGIKLRIADKYFASSKICSCCGHKKKDLTLNDRIYVCDECGLEIDRDINAAVNLLHLKNNKCKII